MEPLAWELPYAADAALKRPKKKKKTHLNRVFHGGQEHRLGNMTEISSQLGLLQATRPWASHLPSSASVSSYVTW